MVLKWPLYCILNKSSKKKVNRLMDPRIVHGQVNGVYIIMTLKMSTNIFIFVFIVFMQDYFHTDTFLILFCETSNIFNAFQICVKMVFCK